MKNRRLILVSLFVAAALICLGPGGASRGLARVVDDFNDNKKTDWTDFTFVPGMGLPVETGGQFKFTLPPAGQALFTASTKTSETFKLQEGRTIEFRVDLVTGNGKDAFAVLVWIPTTSTASSLGGYGLAKSTTDVLITKGINKYFYNENPTPSVKNDNVILVLSLTGKNGNVIINAKVLDKDAQNAVIFEKTVVDTPAADVLSDGTDSPAAPYLGDGNFVLYCYEDFDAGSPQDSYEVIYDNAEAYVLDNLVLDDFNGAAKTGWTDFTFIPGVGLPTQAGGQFTFQLPPAGQSLFSASTKTTRTLDLVEGERIELRADLVSGNGPDAYAVLAWIPTTSSANTLAGYGLAKSASDILVTKGINKYFVDDSPAVAVKNDNVTLALTLTAQNGNVVINGRILDKDSQNAVIWEKTFIDTPQSDVLSDGTDSPAAPYLGSGNFVLYCYEDYSASSPQDLYEVIYDNAEISVPPPKANTAPIIADTQPAPFANFLPQSTQISFTATDDKPLLNEGISVVLNNARYTSTNGLNITGAGNSRTVKLGGLTNNVNYVATLQVVDSDGATNAVKLYFDTFDPASYVIEAEDYNFDGGQFFNNPIVVSEANFPADRAYGGRLGVEGIDYHDTRATPYNGPYRLDDPVGEQRSLDNARAKFTDAGGAAAGVYDYDVGQVQADEYLNYTRNFPAGNYEVYLRAALANMSQAEYRLEKVTSNPAEANQTTTVLGSFIASLTGFSYRNFQLTDGLGKNRAVVHLTGLETLRLHQVTPDAGDGGVYQNFLVFIPVTDAGLQRATVGSVSPTDGAEITSLSPAIQVAIQNRETSVQTNSIKLFLNGTQVSPAISGTADGASVAYVLSPLPPSGSTVAARIIFSDNQSVIQTNDWSFKLAYLSLNAANRKAGPGLNRGFKVRVVQAPAGSNLENSLQRAEDQLAPNSSIPAFYTLTETNQVINYSQNDPGSADGYFPDDVQIPGLTVDNGNDDIAMEILAYLDLTAGALKLGVRCDDGYKIMAGSAPSDLGAPVLAFHNGGPADETFEVYVPETGWYPFRMVWYERGGGAHVEWFGFDAAGERMLLNDPNAAQAIKACTGVAAPAVLLESAGQVASSFTVDTSAVVDANAKTVTVNTSGDRHFYRLKAASALKIQSIKVSDGKVIIAYTD